jgi:hypothetical protein
LSMKEKAKATAPKDRRVRVQSKEAKAKVRASSLLKKTLAAFEKRIASDDFKLTIAEYLKLVQLEQESDQEKAKEIKVTWIDPKVTSDTEE